MFFYLIKGAVIASDATPDKNILSTDTLTYSDIQNKAEYDSSSIGVNLNTTKGVDKKDQGLTPNIGVSASGDADSTTKSAVSLGTIEVRSNLDQDLSKLSRDPAGTLNALGKIFDKKKVQEQQELAKMFGEEAYKLVGELSAKKQVQGAVAKELADKYEKKADEARKNGDLETASINENLAKQYRGIEQDLAPWNEGGANKVALHTLVGGLMAELGGGSFASGATGAAVNEAIQKELSKIKDPAAHQWASAIVGAAASNVVGGNAQTGASTAVSGTANNNFWDMSKGFVSGAAEGFVGDVKDTWNLVTSPGEQLKQVGELAQAIWEIGKTPGGFSELFDALGGEAKDKYQTILAIQDENEKDRQLGLLAGSGVYFAFSTGVAPEKLGVKFPALVAKIEKLKVLKGVTNYTGKIVWPNVPHSNKTPGHWETIVQKAEDVAQREDVAQVYVNKGLSNVTELNNVEPNRRPDIMVVRTDGKIDQYEVLSKTDNRESILERLLDNQRILGDKAGNFYILEPNN